MLLDVAARPKRGFDSVDPCQGACAVVQISTISKSSLRAPHSGQVQFGGICSHAVPGAMPSSGNPAASSYIQPQIRHIHARLPASVVISRRV